MPRLSDRQRIRAILETDRPWSVYALADLEPGFFEHTQWFCAADNKRALALFFAGFAMPVLITVGEPEALQPILNEIVGGAESSGSLRGGEAGGGAAAAQALSRRGRAKDATDDS